MAGEKIQKAGCGLMSCGCVVMLIGIALASVLGLAIMGAAAR